MNRFVQTLCVVGIVTVVVLVNRAFGQTGGPPSSETICYRECEERRCNAEDLQSNYCTCIGKHPSECDSGAVGTQYRGSSSDRFTWRCFGQPLNLATANMLIESEFDNCLFRQWRSVYCAYDGDTNTCLCGAAVTGWSGGNGWQPRYDLASCPIP